MADQRNNHADNHTNPDHGEALDKPARTLVRAIRLTPHSQRERYASEWQADLAEATSPAERRQIARAAMAMARRVRLREFGATLLGGRGAGRAIGWWIGLLVAFILFPVFPLLLAPFVLVVLAIAMVYAGTPSTVSHWLAVGSVVVGIASFSYFWWAVGVNFDASEAVEPGPAIAEYDGEALLLTLVCIVVFIGSVVWSFWRRQRQNSQ